MLSDPRRLVLVLKTVQGQVHIARRPLETDVEMQLQVRHLNYGCKPL
jgi:hypothetical protein